MPRTPDVGARTSRDATADAPGLTRSYGERLRVAAGILIDGQGRVLLAERLHDHRFSGLWEFPGGKIDVDEAPDAALRRELLEELAIEIVACEPLLSVEHDYPDRQVKIAFFLVREWQNECRPLLGQRLRWVSPGCLVADELLPANVAVIEALQTAFRATAASHK